MLTPWLRGWPNFEMMAAKVTNFWSDSYPIWPIFEVTQFRNDGFFPKWTILEVTYFWRDRFRSSQFLPIHHFRGDPSSNFPHFEVIFFEPTYFRSDSFPFIYTFPKILILEMVNFSIRMIFDFQNDPFWNLPNFEVIFFELTHFQSDSFPNWPIPEVTNSRNSDFSQVNHFRSYLFWCDRLRRSLFSKWTIFEANHFRSDPFKMNNFLEVTHF